MLGRALETFFIRVWVVMKLNLYFWLFSVAGGIIFGMGPSVMVVSELFIKYKFDYKEITVKEGWQLFKEKFKRGNYLFWMVVGVTSLLVYNLFLSLQVKGFLFLAIDFILLFGLLYLFASFQYALLFEAQFEISFINLLKLSLISSFSNFFSFLRIVIGSGIIFWLTWKYKGLILFATVGLLLVWNSLATEKWRAEIENRSQ